MADTAEPVLRAALALETKITEHLADDCSLKGQISADKIDERQLAAYDLAYLAAQLRAARALWRFASESGQDLDKRLAAFLIADAANDFAGRVRSRLPEFGLTKKEFEATLGGDQCAAWIAETLAPAFYGPAARLLTQDGPLLGLSSEHEEIRQLFRKFAETKVAPVAEKVHREDLLAPEEVIRDLAQMGCFGLSVPQRYEGFQDDAKPDNLGMVLATEELSRVSLGVAGSLITRPEILAKALLKGGTEEQKAKWLPLIATGQKMVSVAVTEPDYGSDVAGIIVKALPKNNGWVIQGTKMWCTFAGRADLLMVLARTDPDASKKHRGLSVFIVEKPPSDGRSFSYDNPKGGRISGRQIACIGYRGMHTFEVVFEDFWVPAENLIGGESGLGKGFYLQMEGFAGGRLQTAARANGVSQAAIDEALKYALARKVFGKPIAEYQMTQWKLVRMAALLSGSRQLTYEVARLFDEGKGVMEASLVKLFASRIAEWIARESTQIHGAMGYAEETAVSRYFVDARVFSIFEGAEEILALRVIAKTLFEENLKARTPA
ncbi:MAG: acyl-CoA dehydrogenase family protein [Elusimicrobia bacterium]|nr:acyl-CoA dehydrogenase family protein [Elusimicrobiota bacterium]